jgi:hypothetical protein
VGKKSCWTDLWSSISPSSPTSVPLAAKSRSLSIKPAPVRVAICDSISCLATSTFSGKPKNKIEGKFMGAIFKGIYEKKFKILEEKLWSKIFSVCFSAAVFSLKININAKDNFTMLRFICTCFLVSDINFLNYS